MFDLMKIFGYTYLQGFGFRIHFMRIRIHGLIISKNKNVKYNADPDPDPNPCLPATCVQKRVGFPQTPRQT